MALGFTIVLGDWYHNTKAFELNVDNINEYVGQEKHVKYKFYLLMIKGNPRFLYSLVHILLNNGGGL